MEKLKFRRQYLLTPVETSKLNKWQIEKINNHFLYVHPDCQLEKSFGINDLYLVGYFFNPHQAYKGSKDILDELSQIEKPEDFPHHLYSLVGRFVLIIKHKNDFIFFNDACGLKTLYYTKDDNGFYAASQPLLINTVLKIRETTDYEEYFASDYVSKNKEHWLPSGFTFYENVYHLVPNHYIKVSEYKQTRYYPHCKLKESSYDESVKKFSILFEKIVATASKHMNLAFSLTAGWDSRLILSSTKKIGDDIGFYTLRYRNMDDDHMDIRIPKSLSKSLNLKFDVYDCQVELSPEFAEIYKQNSDMAHINDWGKIAYGMFKTYPQEKIAVKGSCSEIGRCFYYPSGIHKTDLTVDDFLKLESGWENLGIIRKQMEQWFNETEKKNFEYNLFDLFYWEHRMGSWQAQSQLEWDIVQEVFTPFNTRELLDIMLMINTSKRHKNAPLLYRDAMIYLWKEVLEEPINPLNSNRKFRKFIVAILRRGGLWALTKKILNK